MNLYNTLTRQTEDFVPLEAGVTKVYTCGPTVYDYAHIGHWFNYVRMDTLIRALKLNNYEVRWVMNITDVGHLVSDADEGEDKLEKGARREGKTAWEIAEFYTRDFFEGMQLLNMLQPDPIVKATDHIAEQIELIKLLETKGYTYVIDDGVYYDTSKFPGYASFARLDLDEQHAGARVNFNEQKHNVSDFALWKFSPTDHQRDMEWDSPWGKGFPGWHIECSAMSMKYLGDTLDIHTGGIDHIPVHHTNEIAQSEAATGKRFSNYWFHSNHVTVNGEKISKSLGNGIRLQDIMASGIPAEAVRLHILESHYRSQSKFSLESLEASHNRLKHWQAVASLVWQVTEQASTVDLLAEIDSLSQAITAAISNDLNTPLVLSLVDELFSKVEAELLTAQTVEAFRSFLELLTNLLGIDLLKDGPMEDESSRLFSQRIQARDAKDWEAADRLRDELLSYGYGLNDTPRGVIWFRV